MFGALVTASRKRCARGLPGLLVLMLLAPGCGKRGAPLPPLPRGPSPPQDVAARQIGNRAVVAFDVPAARGSKPSQQPVRAELVRVGYAPGLEPVADPDAFRRRGLIVGQVVADPLAEQTRVFLEDLRLDELQDGGTGWTLRYAVRVRDRRGRPSPLVVAEDLVPVSSNAVPRSLVAEPTAHGVRLVWEAHDGNGAYLYNVYRSTPGAPWPDAPVNAEPLALTEYLDSDAETGRTYAYVVRVSLAAETPYREGKASTVFELVAEDRFPPERPDGLVAVQEGVGVRLFWNPNSERDVAGYRVFRARDGTGWDAIGPQRLETSSYLDREVHVGELLTYRVTAVDRMDPPNESAPSETIEVELLQEPVAPGRDGR